MENTKSTCDLCQASYTMKHNLQKHLNAHISHLNEQQCVSVIKSYQSTTIKTIKFTCDLCKVSYPLIGKLQSHIDIHIGLHCYLCEASFTSYIQLKSHIRVHSGKKNIQV